MHEPVPVPAEEGDVDRRSLFDLVALVVRYRSLLIGLPLLAAVSAVAFSFLLPRLYTVDSRFIPESTGPQVSRLAGLAAQFGVDIGGGDAGESVDFYAELLESGDLVRNVVLSEFAFESEPGGDTLRGTLVDLLEVKGDRPEVRVRNAVEELSDLVLVRPDPAAKIVTVRTSAPWPDLAVAINQRLLDQLSEFNLERRQSRAAAEREFLESRLAEAGEDLRAAEADMERFLSENRLYAQSPQLAFEHARRQRRLDLLQQLYISLAQGYEQARVDEVRNTPVITVVDQPRGPAKKTYPNVPVNGLLGLVLGGLVAITVVVVREVVGGARRRDPERYRELRESLFGLRRGSTTGRPAGSRAAADEEGDVDARPRAGETAGSTVR